MPNYTMKADAPTRCVTCSGDGWVIFKTMGAPFPIACSSCGQPVHPAIVPGTAATVGAMDPRLDSDPIYMSSLVKTGEVNPRQNPDNYVSGPHSWQRKVDQAQRDGVRLMTNNEIGDQRTAYEQKRDTRKESGL